jgi:predicted enzyme related to lactoylglutathione lyase
VADHPGRLAWYELMTTDIASAKAFYGKVVGWGAQDASAPGLAYTLFTSGKVPVSGLMDLPEEATRMGATPRWIGYVSVEDVEMAADRLRRLGGAVYVPPTDSNIGRISVVADPQTATLALVEGLNVGQPELIEPNKPGRIGWHELLAVDREHAFAFYSELFDWQRADSEPGSATPYQLFSAGGETVGGMFNKRPLEPVPFWLYYFNVGDIDATVERVESAGGEIFEGPLELPGGGWIAPYRASAARMRSAEPRFPKSAGPPHGAAFQPKAEWSSPSPAAGDEYLTSRSSATAGDQPALAAAAAGLGAAAEGLGRGLSCRFDQEM